MAEISDLVRNRASGEEALRRQSQRKRSRHKCKINLIENAYKMGEKMGLAVWTQDEAGPVPLKNSIEPSIL